VGPLELALLIGIIALPLLGLGAVIWRLGRRNGRQR
jgi:hypothetical protein